MTLARSDQFALRVQRGLAFTNAIWFAPLMAGMLRYLGRYQHQDLKRFRRKLHEIIAQNPERPVIICANHLTMIDSLLITWFLHSIPSYLRHFHWFPWNVPEISNFGRNLLTRLMCYLGKCIYVERTGSVQSRRKTFEKMRFLLDAGETLCVFPEGGRSRTGRIALDSSVYGVGELIDEFPDATILALYLRGEKQDSYSFFPKRGERFYADVEQLQLSTAFKGRRAHRDLTLQVMHALQSMEDRFYASRQRHSRPENASLS